jgi:hypothetical protein
VAPSYGIHAPGIMTTAEEALRVVPKDDNIVNTSGLLDRQAGSRVIYEAVWS